MSSNLPTGWSQQPLENLCKRVSVGHVGETSSFFTECSGIPFIRSQNVRPNKVDLTDIKYITRDFHEKSKKSQLRGGDLLIVRVGQNRGDCAVLPEELGELNCANIVFARPERGYSHFLGAYFNTPKGRDSLLAISSGSAQLVLNTKSIAKLSVPVPPLSEAKMIGVLSQRFDERITLLGEINATLESIAQALFKSWFVDFDPVRATMEGRAPEGMDEATAALFPDSFEESELGLVPKGWKVMPFLEVVDLQGGSQPPASTFIDEPREGYVRLLQIRDFSSDAHKTYIPDTDKLKKVSEDDVLIGRYGSASGNKAKDSLGRVCRGLSGSYNVALMKLNPILVGREFALQMVNDPRFYGYLQGVSSKAVQSGFSKAELGQYKVVIPPREVADAYEEFGRLTWTRIKAGAEAQRLLSSLRDTLLPRLISGQLRLPEVNAVA